MSTGNKQRHLPRVILFDAVGTLMVPDPPVAVAYEAVARRYGSLQSSKEIAARFPSAIARHFGLPRSQDLPTNELLERQRWQSVVAEVLSEVTNPSAAFEDLWEHFAQATHWRLYEEVLPVLHELSQRGFHLGIASNFDARLHAILAAFGVKPYCGHVFVSSEIGYSKPSYAFYTRVQALVGYEAQEILMIGDDLRCDVEGPRAAQWQALEINRLEDRENSLCNLTELLDILCVSRNAKKTGSSE